MSCDVRVVSAGPMPVWSNREESPNNGLFIHLTSFVLAAEVERVRVTVELRSNSGQCEVLPGYQVANEETAPGTAYTIGNTYLSADGIHYPTAFTDISSNLSGSQRVRFGLWVRNVDSSAGHTELVLAAIRVEVQARA